MFELGVPPHEYRSDPWRLPLAARVRMLRRRGTRVAYYYHQPDNSTFRYRAYAMAQALNTADVDVSAGYFHDADRDVLPQLMEEVDVLVVARSKYTARLDHLISVARSRRVRILFDCDDLVFDPSLAAMITATLDQDMRHESAEGDELWNVWFGYLSRIRAAMELCDGFISTNRLLVDEAYALTGLPGWVVPNFLTHEQVDYSTRLVEARVAAEGRRDGRLHIGYFSGTPTHNKDFAIVHGALRDIMEAYPDVVVRLVGHLELKGTALSGFAARIDRVPFTDFLNLQRLIAETEVNIAPLQDNRFTNCKSELKFFDAGAVGIPTLASPTFTARQSIVDGVTGRLVKNQEWYQALESIVTDYDGMGRAIGQAAFDAVHAKYRPAHQVPAILTALGLG